MTKYISGIANRKDNDDWSARASANSFHNSDTNKGGGKANEQTASNSWFTARDRSGDNGVAKGSPGGYAEAAQDRGYVGDNGGAGNHKYMALKNQGGAGSAAGRIELGKVQRGKR
jgi:hypothetical protein